MTDVAADLPLRPVTAPYADDHVILDHNVNQEHVDVVDVDDDACPGEAMPWLSLPMSTSWLSASEMDGYLPHQNSRSTGLKRSRVRGPCL